MPKNYFHIDIHLPWSQWVNLWFKASCADPSIIFIIVFSSTSHVARAGSSQWAVNTAGKAASTAGKTPLGSPRRTEGDTEENLEKTTVFSTVGNSGVARHRQRTMNLFPRIHRGPCRIPPVPTSFSFHHSFLTAINQSLLKEEISNGDENSLEVSTKSLSQLKTHKCIEVQYNRDDE